MLVSVLFLVSIRRFNLSAALLLQFNYLFSKASLYRAFSLAKSRIRLICPARVPSVVGLEESNSSSRVDTVVVRKLSNRYLARLIILF